MWIFVQRSGELYHDGGFVSRGWAGRLGGYKNPAFESIADIGPLPCGFYAIGPAYEHPKLGPVTMNLTPDPANEMFDRSDFRIHGASEDQPLLSSEGCIILMRSVRKQIDASPDKQLQVIPGDLPSDPANNSPAALVT